MGLVARWLLLGAAIFGLFAVAFAVVGLADGNRDEVHLGPLATVALLNAAVLGWIASRLRGPRLVASLVAFVAFFGPMSLMSQIESAFFMPGMEAGEPWRIMAAGALLSLGAAPLAVWLFRRAGDAQPGEPERLRLPRGGRAWAGRLTAIALLYVGIYFVFGYYAAWVRPEVRAFYGGIDPAGFWSHLAGIVRQQPELLAFQVLRGLLWAGIAIPLVTHFRGTWWQAGLGVALAFAVFMNAQLLLPNVYMPRDVRLIHLVETAASNALFGFVLVAWLLYGMRLRPVERAA